MASTSRSQVKRPPSARLQQKNAFMCFLQRYRDECPPGKKQKQVATEAAEIWREMTDAQRCPFIQEANRNKEHNCLSCAYKSTSGNEFVPCTAKERRQRPRGGSSGNSKCNSALKNAAHRLIGCLLCHCEYGSYGRGLLFQFQKKADEIFPHLEDESFYVYYKVLISALLGIGLFTVLLTLWHMMF